MTTLAPGTGRGVTQSITVAGQQVATVAGDVRRAKLYYLRDLRGKAAKIKEKRDTIPAK